MLINDNHLHFTHACHNLFICIVIDATVDDKTKKRGKAFSSNFASTIRMMLTVYYLLSFKLMLQSNSSQS